MSHWALDLKDCYLNTVSKPTPCWWRLSSNNNKKLFKRRRKKIHLLYHSDSINYTERKTSSQENIYIIRFYLSKIVSELMFFLSCLDITVTVDWALKPIPSSPAPLFLIFFLRHPTYWLVGYKNIHLTQALSLLSTLTTRRWRKQTKNCKPKKLTKFRP